MPSFTIRIHVTEEPGEPRVYKLDGPDGLNSRALHEIFQRITNDLFIREATERTIQFIIEQKLKNDADIER